MDIRCIKLKSHIVLFPFISPKLEAPLSSNVELIHIRSNQYPVMFSDAGGAFLLAECEHFLSLSSVCLGMLDVEASGYLFHRIRFPDPETGEMPFCLNIHILIVERILMKVRLILVNKFLVYFKFVDYWSLNEIKD